MTATTITLADLDRLAEAEAPDLCDAIITLAQTEPPPRETPLPEGAIAPEQLLSNLYSARAAWSKSRRREQALEVWRKFLNHPDAKVPDRFLLADWLVKLYEGGRETHRDVIVELAMRAPFRLGLWAGLKRIYKLAEEKLDARVWGALAARFDLVLLRYDANEVSQGTFLYLRRRAWRYLKSIGQATPALYPQFAVEVLKHYPTDIYFERTWIGTHVMAHKTKSFGRRFFESRLPADLTKSRAFEDAWKGAPESLMSMLESAQHDAVARFAIQCLRKDVPERLKDVTPAWLERLGRKNLASVHEFLIETLDGSPEFHKGKLKALGLHDTAVSMLNSASDKARKWSIEYARAHAQDLASEELIERFLTSSFTETRKFAGELLMGRKAKELGYKALGRMMAFSETSKWSVQQLNDGFERSEIPRDFLVEMAFAGDGQLKWLKDWVDAKYAKTERDPELWISILGDARAVNNWRAKNTALTELGSIGVKNLPSKWVLDAIAHIEYSATVAGWLNKADALPGLDVERIKGLVFNPQFRAAALAILGNRKLVKPKDIGLPWLLALARRPDASLRDFALTTLLEHSKPEDFGDGDKNAGVTRLVKMAREDKDQPVRSFAQSYLRCHHPDIGKDQPESKQYGIKPGLKSDVFSLERIWPFFSSIYEDARSFAVTIARAELRQWKAIGRLFDLADHEDSVVRRFAFDSLTKAGDPDAPKEHTPTVDELDPARVFALTESRRRATRDIGMALIQKHYVKLGGAEKLGRIMESPDRDVRQFAVRLLWSKHRPRALPEGWKPKGKGAVAPDETTRFEDVDALRDFLRRLLFGLPPGRAGEALEVAATRHVPASVAKRNVIEVVRDLGLEDEAFAQLIAPVLQEFTGSMAKGEWQACLSALAQLRSAHPSIGLRA
ncbi:MAG: hypothetical protein JNK05_36565 [Myxococcales bacterium]|nr:hypothetical protein [Myxococcales bacterium]